MSDSWDELVPELSFCNLSLLGGAACPLQGTSGCTHHLVSPATPDPPCWHAALCRTWEHCNISPARSLSLSSQEEQEEMVQSLYIGGG